MTDRALVAVLAVLAVTAGACGGLRAEQRDHPLAAHEVPYDLLAGPTSTTSPPAT